MSRATTKTSIANRTASLLKVDSVSNIDPPQPGSKFAKECNKWYDDARRAVLQEHIWNFAETEETLAADSNAPTAGKYENRFLLPADYIRIAWVGDETIPATDYKIKGGYIYTNLNAPLQIGYVFDQEDVLKFTPKFITLLSIQLGVFIAYTITGNRTMVADLRQEYDKELSVTATIDGQESPPTNKIRRSRWGAARTGRRPVHGYDGDYQGRVVT